MLPAQITSRNRTIYNQQFLIVGLGNPGRNYRGNRHNLGFILVDHLAARLSLSFTRMQSKALVTQGEYEGKSVVLAKPQTFMNLSGQAVSGLVRFYKLPLVNLLVAYDDVDLPLGSLRLRPSGGSGGHKGMESIIVQLGNQDFPRLRLGVDRPPDRMEAADYVLQNFSRDELESLPQTLDRAVDAVLVFLNEGLQQAMTDFN